MYTRRIELDVTPGGEPKVIHVSQYDVDSRTLEFELFSSGAEFTMPSGATAEINGTKPDGNGFSYTVSLSDNIVTAELTEQMAAVAGKVPCKIIVKKDNKKLLTEKFILSVDRAALDKDTLLSGSEIRELVDVIDRTDEIIAAAHEASEAVDTVTAAQTAAETAATNAANAKTAAETAQEAAEAAARTVSDTKREIDDQAEAITEERNAALASIRDARDNAVGVVDDKAQDVARMKSNAENVATDALSKANNVANQLEEVSAANDQLKKAVTSMQLLLNQKADDGYTDAQGYLHLTANGNDIGSRIGPFAGGGSGGSGGTSGNNAVFTARNATGWISTTIAQGDACNVSVEWSSVEEDLPTGKGLMKIYVGGGLKASREVDQGMATVNIAEYLSVGTNLVTFNVADIYGNNKTFNVSVDVEVLTISSSFDATTQYDGPILFTYTPYGAISKTIYFYLDGSLLDTYTTSASGRQLSLTIPQQPHGMHAFRCYFECEVGGKTVKSNELYYEITCIEELNNTPIITSSFNRTAAVQYETLLVGYTVYTRNSMTSPVSLLIDNTVVNTLTVDRTLQEWSVRMDTEGEHTLTIRSGVTEKNFTLTVTESDVHVEAETEALALHLTAQGRSSSETNPWTWAYENGEDSVEAELTGFNGAQNGWMNDSDGNTVLRVMGGATVEIPFKPFAADPRRTGLTFEMEFATHDVMDYDAVTLSCMSGGRGFQMTAQQATFRSEKHEASAQYNENEHVRLSIVVEKRTETMLIQLYLNGELSRTVQYDEMEDFTQPSPVGISIGTKDCGIDIYNIRFYNNNLTRYQIKDNWIADTQDAGLMLERYRKNDVYDEYGKIVISKLPGNLPYMIIECDELPQYKGDKKTATIHYVDPVNGTMSFEAELVLIDVQGTSSQFYAVKNIKAKFKNGLVVNGTTKTGYALREGTIEVDTFTLKADVASSEGANNVILVRLYEILAKEIGVLTPPQKKDSRIRQGIDGLPMVVFWHDTVTDTTSFVGKYNFNNDKGTENLFGFAAGDESWEVKDDESLLTKFKTNVFGENWYKEDVEARYPEDNQDNTHLSEMVNWVYSTWQENATGNALEETYTDVDGITHTVDNAAYRLAKFKTEFEDYFDLDNATLYYLFTLHFLMANSRQKNMFPTYWGSTGKWTFLPYDFDTGLGTDNRGTLTYKYSYEDIDMHGNRMVFDGQDVVLWVNFRQAFWPEVAAMYQQLRSSGKFSYEYVEAMFEEHQGKWPVSIFNEDAFYKYINPLIQEGNANYLEMAQGSKTLQRRFWLANRFDYMDSLMVSGNARTNWINIRPIYSVTEEERAAGAVDLQITPYADIYVTVDFDSRRRQIRADRETTVTIENPATMMSFGNVVAIYSADKIADVGDLSPLKLSYADFSAATRLQRIKVGDAAPYENPNLQTLSVGTNPLMKVLDARNCTALTGTLDASGCKNIEEIYVEGTALAGVSVPNGGVLRNFHLSEKPSSLIIRNQPNLIELTVPDYSGITTLWLENIGTAIDEKAILAQIQAGARVRLIGIAWEAADAEEIDALYDLLDTMRGLDENGNNTDKAQVSGTIHVAALRGSEVAEFQSRYPYIRINADAVASTLVYKSYDGSETLKTVTCHNGVPQSGAPSIPSRSQTAQYTFSAAGWATLEDQQSAEYPAAGPTTGMQADTTLYAAYSATVRTYTVTWKNSDGTVLETDNNVAYGATPHYDGSTPQNPTSGGGAFQSWTPAISSVTGNVTYTASYIKTYTVYFYNGNELLQTVEGVREGASATYTGSTPIYNGTGDPGDYDFTGWSPSPTNITANTSCYAQFSLSGVAETITDSWDQIIANVSNGSYKTKYQVGDTKKISLGTEGVVAMQIVAMDTDELASGSGTAPITFISQQLLKTNHRMNPAKESGTIGTGALGGWEHTEMRAYLKDTIKPLIPSNVRSAIKEVKKYSRIYDASESEQNNVVTTDDVWIPSRKEVAITGAETSGATYSVFSDNASRIKMKTGASSGSGWWLRSADDATNCGGVGSNGSSSYGSANSSNGVALGFCI